MLLDSDTVDNYFLLILYSGINTNAFSAYEHGQTAFIIVVVLKDKSRIIQR